jgi:hypothetical protein
MTVTSIDPRSTSTSTASRTAAATAARRLRAAQKAAIQLGRAQVDYLDDEHLVALALVLLGEVRRRGLEVPDPDE